MATKNSEALTTCDSQGLGVRNLKRVTDMKSIANSELNFHGTALIPVKDVNGIWLTSADVAKALGYKSTKSISNLFWTVRRRVFPGDDNGHRISDQWD